ncbi:MAG: bifunctional riboflavin kinase/FAD synthetase [Chloroflexi bacterium]|nr:bifunctional riboflavin kinase/FAD synthetase [Chloroflexota bacterium]
MQIVEQLSQVDPGQGTFLTIGSFDGVHVGHQYLIQTLVRQAREDDRRAALLTFHPHPRSVLSTGRPLEYLSSVEEKQALFAALGLDLAAIVPFTSEVAGTEARAFMVEVQRRLNLEALWIGQDFALGRQRSGDAAALARLGEDLGFAVHVLPHFQWRGRAVSSTRIRTLLRQGQARQAAALLGRPYALSGPVVPGARRGAGLGFPTANVEFLPGRLVPARGVYATFAWLEGRSYPAVTNVGTSPTFGPGHLRLEAYLLDFVGDLYGQTLTVQFVERLRPELQFPDARSLIRQMEQDVVQGRQLLAAEPRQPLVRVVPLDLLERQPAGAGCAGGA